MALFGPSDDALYALAASIRSQAAAITQLSTEIRDLRKQLKRPPRPGLLKLRIVGEKAMDGMADRLKFLVLVPAEPTPTDVVKREVIVLDGGTLLEVAERDGNGVQEIGPFEGDENASIEIRVVNIDNAGNRSPARSSTHTLVDTIAPPAPGEVGLTVVGETPAAEESPAEEVPPQQPEPPAEPPAEESSSGEQAPTEPESEPVTDAPPAEGSEPASE